MALVHRDEIVVEPFGVRDNRRFHVIGEGGRLLNGKQLGELQQISASWDETAGSLAFDFPDGNAVDGTIELGEAITTIFFGRPVDGRLVVGPWSEALTEFVGREIRLVQSDAPGAAVDRGAAGVTMLSTGSLEAMRTAAGIAEAVDPRRFRMLFGLEGIEAHEEDEWVGRRVRIGEVGVLVRGNVGRCIVTSRHPDTGVRNLATLDVLAEYRDGVPTTEALPFGIWAKVEEPGVVRLGDAVVPD
jgi:MOSC domain-containing protein